MKRYATKKILLSFVLLIWLLISILRGLYNDSKLFTQDRYLFTLSNYERRREVYGDIYVMASEILKITSGESILLTGNDGGLYFYLRYLLYPQKVYWVNNISLEEEKERSWKYVFRPYETKLRDQNDVRAVTPVVDSLSKKQLGILITL